MPSPGTSITAKFETGPIHGQLRTISYAPIYLVPVFKTTTYVTLSSDEYSTDYLVARYLYGGFFVYPNTYLYRCSNVEELVEAGWRPVCGQNLCSSQPCEHSLSATDRLRSNRFTSIQRPPRRTNRASTPMSPDRLRSSRSITLEDALTPTPTSPDSYRFNATVKEANTEIEEWNKFVSELKERIKKNGK